MKVINALLLALMSVPCNAQTMIGSGDVPGTTFRLHFETRVEPSGTIDLQSRNRGFSGTPTHIVLERYLTDPVRKTYFGYRVLVTAPESGYSLLMFSRLPMNAEIAQAAGITNPGEWTYLGLDETKANGNLVRLGDAVELDLLRNPRTGQRIIERISVLPPNPKMARPQQEQARDFSLNDLEMSVIDPRLFVNGSPAVTFGPLSSATGKTITIEVPTMGRYILSPVPDPSRGFAKVGSVRGNSLRFRMGEDSFTVFSKERILPGQDYYNLYVLRAPPLRTIGPPSITPGFAGPK